MPGSALDAYRDRIKQSGMPTAAPGTPTKENADIPAVSGAPTKENAAQMGLPFTGETLSQGPGPVQRTWDAVRGSVGAGSEGLFSGATAGWGPWMYDKLFGDTSEAREMGRINHPVASALGETGGFALGPEALAAKGVTKGTSLAADLFKSPALRKAGSGVGAIGGGVNAGVAGGSASLFDELSRSYQEGRDPNYTRVARDAGFNAAGGGIMGTLFGRTAPNVVRNRIGGRGNAAPDLPGTLADPTGVIPPQPLRGPEALKQNLEPQLAAAAERLRLDAAAKVPQHQPPQGLIDRPAAIQQGADIHGSRVDTADALAAQADEGGIRSPGGVPAALQHLRPEIAIRQGLPHGFEGPRDSVDMWKQMLERARADRVVTPPEKLAAHDAAIKSLEDRLRGKAPAAMNADKAQTAATDYAKTWSDLPVTPAAKPNHELALSGVGGLIGGATGGKLTQPFGFGGAGALGGATAGALAGQKIGKRLPDIPILSSPEKILGLLENPAALTQALKDPSYLRLLQTNLAPTMLGQLSEGAIAGLAGDPKKKPKSKRY
jgi:hypothetical protein